MIETTLNQLLSSLSGGKVYPFIAPQGTSPPYLIYSVISERDSDVFAGQAETNYRVQIDVYANRLQLAKQIITQARNNITSLEPSQFFSTSGYEHDTKLYRATVEFSVIA